MKKISEHLGEIIVALAAISLLVCAVVVFKAPLGSFFGNIISKETSIADTVLGNLKDFNFDSDGNGDSGDGEALGFPIEWNTMDVMGNTSFVFQNMPFVKVSEFTPSATELAGTEISAMGTSLAYAQAQDMGGFALAVYGDSMFTFSVTTAGEYADLGISFPEAGFYALDFGTMGEDLDLVIDTICAHEWGEDDYCTLCGVYKYSDFTVTNSNRAKVGYTGAENENLVIPATFYDEEDGKYYKVVAIGDSAFSSRSNLTSITIPDSVTSIGESAFNSCSNLTSIVIPDSVTSIGESAFYNCSNLTSITIPVSVTSIGKDAFGLISNVKNVVYAGSFIQWLNISFSNRLSNPAYGSNLYVNTNELVDDVVIPDNISNIGNALSGCTSLVSVTIPDSVTSIGEHAFSQCTNLTSIVIPDSVTSIGRSAFMSCSNLTSISIPDSVTCIGEHAFSQCTNLTSIVIPDSVTSIGSSTFWYCTSLTSITIPDSVTSIGEHAFYNCRNLTDVYYTGSEDKWGTISISGDNNDFLTSATIHYNWEG